MHDHLNQAVDRALEGFIAAKKQAIQRLLSQGVAPHRISSWRDLETMQLGIAIDQEAHVGANVVKPACTFRAQVDGTVVTEWHEPWEAAS